MLKFMHGDMFEAPADIRVNTVNCVGAMGAGVALAFKRRYPEMFRDYQRDCKSGLVRPGKMHIWKSLSGDWIVNFPTKRDWREPSRYEDIEAGLDDLRAYLKMVGPVTVALPALGCGNGGLDWGRVSKLISEKLDGLDANVLIFEPAASRQAGRVAIDAPTADELRASTELGYQFVTCENTAFGLTKPAYVSGNQKLLSHKWIALMHSRSPNTREMQALNAIATQMARSTCNATIALIYSASVSEEVAQLFVSRGISTVVILPFGVLTRKSIARYSVMVDSLALTLVSFAPPSAKWSRYFYAQAVDMLRANAPSVLLSDPEPDWFTSKGVDKWAKATISFVLYETTQPHVREALLGTGAKPIVRRSEDGSPNIASLIASFSDVEMSAANSKSVPLTERAESVPRACVSLDGAEGGDTILTITVRESSIVTKRKLFEALLPLEEGQLDVTISLPRGVSDADRRKLIELGFSQRVRDRAFDE